MHPPNLTSAKGVVSSMSKADQMLTWLFPGDKSHPHNVERGLRLPEFSDNASISSSMQAEVSSSMCGDDDLFSDQGLWDLGWPPSPVLFADDAIDSDSFYNLLGAGSMFDELEKLNDEGCKSMKGLDTNTSDLHTDGPAKLSSSHLNNGETESMRTNLPGAPTQDTVFNSRPTIYLRQEMDPADFREYPRKFSASGSETEPSMPDSSRDSRETVSSIESSAWVRDHEGHKSNPADLVNPSESPIDLDGDKEDAIDRLAIHFDAKTILLLGQSELLCAQTTESDAIALSEPTLTAHTDFSTHHETATARSKNVSWDEAAADDWLSDITEHDEALDDGHPFLKCREELLLCGLQKFRAYVIHCQGNDSTEQHQLHGSEDSQDAGHGHSKRSLSVDDDSLNSGASPITGRKPPKRCRAGGVNRERTLACLFYKRNQIQHIDCLQHTLRRVKDVKQHLWRKHRQPQLYCPTCYEVFTERLHHDSHIQARTCSRREHPVWDGLSENLRDELSRRVDAGISEEEQWFSVWDIVFPGVERPRTAYLGGPLEELIEMLREYWGSSGQEVISTVLDQRGLPDWHMLSEERDLAILLPQLLWELISTILDQFLMSTARTIGQVPAISESFSALRDPQTTVARPSLPTPALSHTSSSQVSPPLPLPVIGENDFPSSEAMFSDTTWPTGHQRGVSGQDISDQPTDIAEPRLNQIESNVHRDFLGQESQGILELAGVLPSLHEDISIDGLAPNLGQQEPDNNDGDPFMGFG